MFLLGRLMLEWQILLPSASGDRRADHRWIRVRLIEF
jgi:hypothetical protein